MKDKQETINAINSIKNTPIAPQKNDLLANAGLTDPKDSQALMAYNAMLDNITIGPHTNTTIDLAGYKWVFRLLTAEEYVNMRMEVEKECRKNEIFDDYFVAYATMTKTLSLAMSPSPFKTEGKDVFSEEDLRLVNFDLLETLYSQYVAFVQVATRKPTNMSDEEILALWSMYQKKPEALKGLEPWKLETMFHYVANCLLVLEKIQKSDTSSSSS